MNWILNWPVAAAVGLALLGVALGAAIWWLRRRPPVPMVRPGVLHELLLAAPIRLWALIMAGPALTVLAAWLIWLIRYLPDADPEQKLTILGNSLYIVLVELGIIVISLAAAKVSAETRLGKFIIDGDPDDDAPPMVAQVTTTTTVAPAAPAAPSAEEKPPWQA